MELDYISGAISRGLFVCAFSLTAEKDNRAVSLCSRFAREHRHKPVLVATAHLSDHFLREGKRASTWNQVF